MPHRVTVEEAPECDAGWLDPISRKKMRIQEREGRQEQRTGAKSLEMGEYWDPKH